ncbi:MAG TPA: hypothetical protein VEF76_13675, partial [Patescibacteria group bacterium]|nr:hypothetical protein [Patescibacteria group bacterium]
EFPKEHVKSAANDFYGLLKSADVSDGISQAVRAFDEEKVKDLLDKAMTKLQEEETSLKVAKGLKDILAKTPNDKIEEGLDQLLATRADGEAAIVKMLFDQFKPVLDDMRDGSVEDVAAQVRDIAATIPTDALAANAAALTREVTPERVAKQAEAVTGKLPSANAVSDIVHGLGTLASDKLGDIAKSKTPANDVKSLPAEFAAAAQDLVAKVIKNDKDKPKPSKGQKFDL